MEKQRKIDSSAGVHSPQSKFKSNSLSIGLDLETTVVETSLPSSSESVNFRLTVVLFGLEPVEHPATGLDGSDLGFSLKNFDFQQLITVSDENFTSGNVR